MNRILLEEERTRRNNPRPRDPFQHQIEALVALNRVFNEGKAKSKAGLLVFPTGAGKTFTMVKWLCDYALPNNAMVLWLAHTFHLLDQAFETFMENCIFVPHREQIYIGKFSSHPSHQKVFAIDPIVGDVVIMTTQTAISNWDIQATGLDGRKVRTKFEELIRGNTDRQLFIILDEAHHAPAYGCRKLFSSIREAAPNANFVGLTATPTFYDETRRGWLKKLFPEGIICEADKDKLLLGEILARPKFIQKDTKQQYVVPEDDYNKIMREHIELPEKIINVLATDAKRNDYIVNTYAENKVEYGKTLIFADRWFQCNYLVDKLRARGIRADYVYSHIDADPGSIEARNNKATDRNKQTIGEFKNGQLDVLVNVRMLTEGTDIPDTKTVFVTRQTTSQTLFTQMIGRALRGKKAGGGEGKSEANIVLFMDNWTKLINWANWSQEGGIDEERIITGYRPLEYISIHLVDELCRQINFGFSFQPGPFLSYMPVGWYEVDIITNVGTGEETDSQASFCMVYEHTKAKFEQFIEDISRPNLLSQEWANETLEFEWMAQYARQWMGSYFEPENDDIGNELVDNLIKIARHIAQKETAPGFVPFDDRNKLDLDSIAKEIVEKNLGGIARDDFLQQKFREPGNLFMSIWKDYEHFEQAVHRAERRQIEILRGVEYIPKKPSTDISVSNLPSWPSPEVVGQIKERDNYTCQACHASGRGVKLEIDHIVPRKFGGDTSPENLQVLCSVCNKDKKINAINFKFNKTELTSEPKELVLLPRNSSENVEYSMRRVVNFFYRCQAVCKVTINRRKDAKYYSTWRIELYHGNNPEWLIRHKPELIEHIRNDFNRPSVTDLEIVGA